MYRGYRLRVRISKAKEAFAVFQRNYRERKQHEIDAKTKMINSRIQAEHAQKERRNDFISSKVKQLQVCFVQNARNNWLSKRTHLSLCTSRKYHWSFLHNTKHNCHETSSLHKDVFYCLVHCRFVTSIPNEKSRTNKIKLERNSEDTHEMQ